LRIAVIDDRRLIEILTIDGGCLRDIRVSDGIRGRLGAGDLRQNVSLVAIGWNPFEIIGELVSGYVSPGAVTIGCGVPSAREKNVKLLRIDEEKNIGIRVGDVEQIGPRDGSHLWLSVRPD
jgi:hypothetical protein